MFCAGAIRWDLWERCSSREQKVTRKLQEVVAGGSDLAHWCRGRITHCTETPVRIRITEDPNTPPASFRPPAKMKELQKYLFWIYLFPFYCQEMSCLHPRPTVYCWLSGVDLWCHVTWPRLHEGALVLADSEKANPRILTFNEMRKKFQILLLCV